MYLLYLLISSYASHIFIFVAIFSYIPSDTLSNPRVSIVPTRRLRPLCHLSRQFVGWTVRRPDDQSVGRLVGRTDSQMVGQLVSPELALAETR